MSKFTLQISQTYERPQFSQTVNSRLQWYIQNSAKHLRSGPLRKKIEAFSS